jgi:DNA-binding LacI/PurR family transcriptional regulator
MGARLQDVATAAGVSVRTVSNVVNDFPHVAAGTRARVQATIDELGYRPNLAARTLRRSRTGLVSLVVPELDSPYFAELAARIVAGAHSYGWTVLIDQTRGDEEHERRLIHGVRNQLVDGLIFSPWSVPPAELLARTDDIALVLLGEHGLEDPLDAGRFSRVVIDNVAAAQEATAHLLAGGARRIAAVGLQPHLHNCTAHLRVRGYRAALSAAGIAPDPALEVPVRALHRADGAQAFGTLLDRLAARGEQLDGAFFFTDELALGGVRAAVERGLHVPTDLTVAGFDDIVDGRFSVPTLTTIAPDKQGIADAALRSLADQLAGSGAGVAVPARHRLVVRESSTRRQADSVGR